MTDGTRYINEYQGGYWRADRKCSDGRFVMAQGVSSEEASAKADAAKAEVERYLTLNKREKLAVLMKQESLGSTAQEEAIRIIAAIILEGV